MPTANTYKMMKILTFVPSTALLLASAATSAACYAPHNVAYGYDLTTCIIQSESAHAKLAFSKAAGNEDYETYDKETKCIHALRKEGEKQFKEAKACLKKRNNREALGALSDLYGDWSALVNNLYDPTASRGFSQMIDRDAEIVRKKYKTVEFMMQ